MTNLLHTEWLKMHKYKAFWWMAGIIVLTYPGINYLFYEGFQQILKSDETTGAMVKMLVGDPFTFPEVWHSVAYLSSMFVFIPAVIIIMFITNEYTYKTHRQNIIDGWSRQQFMVSKMIDVLMVSLVITILYTIVSLITGYVNQHGANVANPWEGSKYILLFWLQSFSQLSIAFLIAFLVRKAFIALGIFMVYFLIVENLIVLYSKVKLDDIGRFMPIEISDRVIPPLAFMNRVTPDSYKAAMNNIGFYVALTIILTAVIWLICFAINKKRDL